MTRDNPEPSTQPEVQPHVPRVVNFDGLQELGVLLSKRQIDRLEARNKFPKRLAMSMARVGWLTAEIVEYVDDCVAKRSMKIGTLGSDSQVRKPPHRNAPMLGPAGAIRKTKAA